MWGRNIKKEYIKDDSLEIQKIIYEEIKNTKRFSPVKCFFYNVLDFNSTVVSITDCKIKNKKIIAILVDHINKKHHIHERVLYYDFLLHLLL